MNKHKLSKKTIVDLYVKQRKSAVEISQILGIKSPTTIYDFMKKHGIDRRISTDSELRALKSRNANWTGCGEISGAYWYGIQFRANRRKLDFDITINYAWELFVKQDGKCAISGLPIQFWEKNSSNADKKKQTASLDRIDSSKGYVVGNIQWVHKSINTIKMDLNQEEFIELCKIVTRHQESAKLS